MKNIKIFLKKKKVKDEKRSETEIKILFEEQKHILLEYMKKYYLAHKKWLLVTLKILGQSNLFHGLFLEMLGNSEIFYEFKDFANTKKKLWIFLIAPGYFTFQY